MPSRKTERLKTLFKQDEIENAYFGESVEVDEKTFENVASTVSISLLSTLIRHEKRL